MLRQLVRTPYILVRRLIRGTCVTRWPWLQRIHDKMLPYLKNEHVVVRGHRMKLDPNDSLELSVREYEPGETRLILEHVKPGMTVVDIGANIGYYTLLMARQVGPAGKVFAFEPDPFNFSLLEENVRSNGYKNVTLINAALSERTGTVQLAINSSNRGDHRMDACEGAETVTVPCWRFDDYAGEHIHAAQFIKTDTQGAEAVILPGMKQFVAAQHELTLVTEFWPKGLARFGMEGHAFLALLHELGFLLFSFNDDGRTQSIEKAHLEQYMQAADGHTNLLGVKNRQP